MPQQAIASHEPVKAFRLQRAAMSSSAIAAVPFSFILIVACVLAATGCALVIYGCVVEAQYQLDLLRMSGPAALDAYLAHVASHQLSFAAYMVESVTGRGYEYGAFLQGAGAWLVFVVTPVVTVLLCTARWFVASSRTMNPRLRLAAVH